MAKQSISVLCQPIEMVFYLNVASCLQNICQRFSEIPLSFLYTRAVCDWRKILHLKQEYPQKENCMITFKRTLSDNTDFQNLVALLDAELRIRDGDEHNFYAQFNKIENIRNVVVCYIDNKPIGCGAFKKYDDKRVEIKRMFVLPGYRGQGIGHNILKELEEWASALNYNECILETGKKQPEAIRLYQKAGYAIMKNYGQYENVENSVCMTKAIL